MRLKSLTLKGFKSFADETVIHFQDDVIGIVGPNGSGKSNIVDAVRWVLGEQKSRELRLDQMSSVIFNGTKKRKPGGVAQVSITFDNTRNILPTEYETLTISRLLYRSGESEYRLNGVPCRLKDITNLFMDTGIGSNSYAIIALGMVDDILADKDNARLRMFEQAAGISRYKVRKRETLNKLNQTTADLERVEDLLHEIEQNLKALEKQARRTKRFFELRDRYRQVSLELAAYRVEDLKKKQLEVRGQLEKEEDALRGLEVEITRLEAQLEAERKANLDKEKLLSERQRELNALVGRIRELENDRRMLEQRSHFVEENRRKLEEQIRTDGAKIESTTREIESFRQRLQEEKQIEATLEEQLVEAETALEAIRQEHGSLKADLDKIMQEQQQTERRLFELEKQKAVNANQVHTLRTDLERRQYDAAQRQADREALQQQLRKLESAERRARQALEELEKDEKRRRSSIQELEKQQELLRQELQNINRRLDAKRNEYQLTRSMVENLEGFPESIRFLSSHKQWKKDAPLLSDLIYVEEEYRVAIENYLEPYLNYYVVENLEEALRAIQLLNESQKGKANFFLLDAFRDYTPPIALLPEARQAIELVRCDPAYQRLVSYLLENVLITDSEERARQTPPDGVVLLSKTGHFVRRKFSVGGGSVGLFEGKKIGRKKNLEILQEEIRKLERKEQKLSGELFTLAQRLETLRTQSLPEKIQEATRELNRIGQEKVQTVTRLEALDAQLHAWQEAQEAARKRIAELEAANAAIEEDLAEQRARVAAAKQRIASTDGTYRRAAEKLSQASTEFNARNIEFIKQQNTVSALQRELAFRERALDETRAARAANEKALLAGQDELEQIATQIQELEQDLLKAYDDKKSKESRLTEAEQAYFKARGGINEIEDRIRQLNRKRNDALLLLNRLKDRLNELRLQLQSIAERLRVEFNVDVNQLPPPPPPPDDTPLGEHLAALQVKVEKLKSRLDNYGEINPMAVEAFDEMKERHDTIAAQREDILQAKEDLLETMREIEDTATRRFLEAFEQVRLYFIDIFRELFSSEDNADLILLDPENPLESKIEIVAKPKGKRPQTISQLSGGEKTLTATALLFALYLLKPAPFCIFDEVDAPLDDANIEKFNRIIRKFSRDSQFIIVTHNKQTMAAVGTIYGVYMAEQGVSSVTPVDFRRLQHEEALEVVERG